MTKDQLVLIEKLIRDEILKIHEEMDATKVGFYSTFSTLPREEYISRRKDLNLSMTYLTGQLVALEDLLVSISRLG
jgi:hypothetical protein